MAANRHLHRKEAQPMLFAGGRATRSPRFPATAAALVAGALSVGPAVSAGMPAEIAAPGETAVLTLHAEGAQIYECRAGEDEKLAWAFREPVATLVLDGKTVGRHYAGPNWDYVDGSGVAAKVVAKVPGTTASDIPWLKLEASSHRGTGMLAAVTGVQRVNTMGGMMSGNCDQMGAFRSVPYSADYVFLEKDMTQ